MYKNLSEAIDGVLLTGKSVKVFSDEKTRKEIGRGVLVLKGCLLKNGTLKTEDETIDFEITHVRPVSVYIGLTDRGLTVELPFLSREKDGNDSC